MPRWRSEDSIMRRGSPIHIPDHLHIQKEELHLPKFYQKYIDYGVISEVQIQERVDELAIQLLHEYSNVENLHLLCVLKGASIFFHDLLKRLIVHAAENSIQIDYDFIRVSSYSNTQSTGDVKITGLSFPLERLQNKHLLLVEDIIDTGNTMTKLIPFLQENVAPKSIEVISLLEKRIPSSLYQAKYVGFSIPNCFIVGYGLDYNEKFRDMNALCVLNQLGIDNWKK